MKKFIAILSLMSLMSCDTLQQVMEMPPIDPNGGGLSTTQVAEGLKEALKVGIQNAVTQANKTDGYNKNSLIRIPFPPEVEQVENTLRNMGFTGQIDEFVVKMNRTAEEAAAKAAPIFVDAILGMTIDDAWGLLKNESNDAATNYLRKKTYESLYSEFTPIVQEAMNKTQLNNFWTPLASAYNNIPFKEDVNPDLTDYVTRRAIDGLFTLVAQEEAKIRQDPAARVNDLLKKVFGQLD